VKITTPKYLQAKQIIIQPQKKHSMITKHRPIVQKTILALAVAAGLSSFAENAKAAQTYWPYYNFGNLAAGNTGDRISSGLRGMAQSFHASASSSIGTVAFGLYNLSEATGDLAAGLFSVSGSPLSYSIGSQIGSTAWFDTTDITGSYTAVDVTDLNWAISSGENYAIALWAGSNFYNPQGGGGGINWVGSSAGSSDNLDHHNNWAVGIAGWEDWGNSTSGGFNGGLSVGLNSGVVASAAVPEPSTCALIGMGALALFARRRKVA